MSRTKGSSRAAGRRFRPGLEALERRDNPNGNVLVSVAAGVMTITAVDYNLQADVVAGLNDQQITITGTGANAFDVSGDNTTLINGIAGDFIVAKITTIKIDMKRGNDTVRVLGANLSGNFSFTGGSGDDDLQIVGGAGDQSFGSLTVRDGDGDDSLTLASGNVTVAGALSFNGGVGDSSITFGIAGGDSVTLGSLAVTNGDGFDQLAANGANFTCKGPVSINNGNGDSRINFTAVTILLGGPLNVTNGDGNDTFGLGNAASGVTTKSITINNGNGDSITDILGSTNTVTGNISITNKDGSDIADFSGLQLTGSLTINDGAGDNNSVSFINNDSKIAGSLLVSSVAGTNSFSVDELNFAVTGITSLTGADYNVTIGGTPDTIDLNAVRIRFTQGECFAIFSGTTTVASLTVTGGFGYQEEIDLNDTFTCNGALTFNPAAGGSRLAANNTVLIKGPLTYTAFDGADAFTTDGPGFTVNGAVNVSLGDGTSSVILGATTNDFNGGLTVTGGALRDDFTVTGAVNAKSLTINDGNGENRLDFFGDTTVAGNLAITTGAAADEITTFSPLLVTLPTVSVNGTVTINTGSGDDSITWTGPGNTLGAAVTITTGDGSDQVTLSNWTVTGPVSVSLGNGNDQANVDASTFNNTVTLDAGTGKDRVGISAQDSGVSSTFKKAVTIRLGDGDDLLDIGRDADTLNFAAFLGAVNVNGGLGLDTAHYLPTSIPAGTRNNTFVVLPVATGVEVVL